MRSEAQPTPCMQPTVNQSLLVWTMPTTVTLQHACALGLSQIPWIRWVMRRSFTHMFLSVLSGRKRAWRKSPHFCVHTVVADPGSGQGKTVSKPRILPLLVQWCASRLSNEDCYDVSMFPTGQSSPLPGFIQVRSWPPCYKFVEFGTSHTCILYFMSFPIWGSGDGHVRFLVSGSQDRRIEETARSWNMTSRAEWNILKNVEVNTTVSSPRNMVRESADFQHGHGVHVQRCTIGFRETDGVTVAKLSHCRTAASFFQHSDCPRDLHLTGQELKTWNYKQILADLRSRIQHHQKSFCASGKGALKKNCTNSHKKRNSFLWLLVQIFFSVEKKLHQQPQKKKLFFVAVGANFFQRPLAYQAMQAFEDSELNKGALKKNLHQQPQKEFLFLWLLVQIFFNAPSVTVHATALQHAFKLVSMTTWWRRAPALQRYGTRCSVDLPVHQATTPWTRDGVLFPLDRKTPV